MTSSKKISAVVCFSLLLVTELWIVPVEMHHHNNRGNSGIEMLLAAGILAKLLNKHHHGHHQSHPIPIPIPVPVHHGGGGHEVVHHHGGHHDHHGHGSSNYYGYAPYGETYYAAPSAYMPAYYK
ncbi:hypothetical protein TNCT_394891 [Trichonephila clavata]|uniref:Uncharacterized protein n=1 Tax=Trichonephila clavata TaxID=2740835 RepID=A0A8X6LE36_TRICU|nr:hypothetical protein TNCT_394891 [Trichonephila clavata]